MNSFDDEEELTRQITVSSASGPSNSKTGGTEQAGYFDGLLSLESGKEWRLECKLG